MSKKTKKYIPIAGAFAIVVAILWFGFFATKQVTPSSEWKTYRSEVFGYTFSYPSNLVLRDEGVQRSLDDRNKRMQYVHASANSDGADFGMTVAVNPAAHGMCEEFEWDVPEHKVGNLTFSGCGYTNNHGERVASEVASFISGGNVYEIFLGYPMSLQGEAYAMAESFKTHD